MGGAGGEGGGGGWRGGGSISATSCPRTRAMPMPWHGLEHPLPVAVATAGGRLFVGAVVIPPPPPPPPPPLFASSILVCGMSICQWWSATHPTVGFPLFG